jgi:cytochrome c oxidase cbb3-type subunit 1
MSELNAALEHPVYNYKVVRQFAVMTVIWGIVGMLVGVIAAARPGNGCEAAMCRITAERL